MSMRVRRSLRFLLLGTVLAVGVLAVSAYFGSSQASCDRAPCHNCPHEVCVSACWVDGTYIDNDSCTKVKHTPFAPIECPPGGGCLTQSCN